MILIPTFDEIRILQAMKKQREQGVPDEIIKNWDQQIDAEFKRRNKPHAIADDPRDYARGRQLGEQDIGDISYKEPWQKIVRDQLGLTFPINSNYKCPVCQHEYALDFPPDRCIYCGTRSFLHLKKLVNLKV